MLTSIFIFGSLDQSLPELNPFTCLACIFNAMCTNCCCLIAINLIGQIPIYLESLYLITVVGVPTFILPTNFVTYQGSTFCNFRLVIHIFHFHTCRCLSCFANFTECNGILLLARFILSQRALLYFNKAK